MASLRFLRSMQAGDSPAPSALAERFAPAVSCKTPSARAEVGDGLRAPLAPTASSGAAPGAPASARAEQASRQEPLPVRRVRRKLRGKAPSVVGVIHRFWIGRAAALPFWWREAVASWAPARQWLWTYPDLWGTGVELPPGVELKSLEEVLGWSVCRHMMQGDVPVQMIKDVCSLLVLHAQGGWSIDLDVVCLGRPLPHAATALVRVSEHRITFAFLAAARGACWTRETAHRLKSFWEARAMNWWADGSQRRLPVMRSGVHGRSDLLWTHNQRVLAQQVARTPALAEAVLPEGPFLWLSRDPPPAAAPTTEELSGCLAVAMFSRQWPQSTTTMVLGAALAVRNMEAPVEAAKALLREALPHITLWGGEGWGHLVYGNAMLTLDAVGPVRGWTAQEVSAAALYVAAAFWMADVAADRPPDADGAADTASVEVRAGGLRVLRAKARSFAGSEPRRVDACVASLLSYDAFSLYNRNLRASGVREEQRLLGGDEGGAAWSAPPRERSARERREEPQQDWAQGDGGGAASSALPRSVITLTEGLAAARAKVAAAGRGSLRRGRSSLLLTPPRAATARGGSGTALRNYAQQTAPPIYAPRKERGTRTVTKTTTPVSAAFQPQPAPTLHRCLCFVD